MNITEILTYAVEKGASDIFIISGASLAYKISNNIEKDNESFLMPNDTKSLVNQIFELAGIENNIINSISKTENVIFLKNKSKYKFLLINKEIDKK